MTNETRWSIDQAHSEISFKAKHLMIAYVKGSFKTFEAQIFTTGDDFTLAKMNLKIDTSSITTGDTTRDTHLKSADFLDTQHHSQILFTSKTIEKFDALENYNVFGDLKIKDVIKPIKLKVQFGGIAIDQWGNQKAGFAIKGKIYRSDWGLIWNATMETFGLIISDEIIISSEIELNKFGQKDVDTALEPEASENGLVINQKTKTAEILNA